jgi:aminoglycoside phosphotransferase family enzyme/predicted kinase
LTQGVEREIADWFAARSDRTIETALARVFLAGDTAFKLKRQVLLSYVDFSTAERRRWALARELEFNQAAAPDVYRAVRRISRASDGGLELDGPGETLDYALEMRRFDDSGVLAVNPAALDGAMADRLGRVVAGFHARAPLRPEGGLSALAFTVGSNALLLRELAPRLGADRVERLVALTEAEFARHTDLLARRTAAGFSRRCHGDLHLGNILVEGGETVLFDCIEFNDLLSDLDVQFDLAFLLMDLDFRGRADAAVRVLSSWLDEAARHFPDTVWDGLAALPLMLSVRAGVRAHVCAHGGDDALAIAYVDAAIAHLSPAPAVLAAVGGLSGAGKSGFARRIAPRIGPAPGAVILRTDEVRKRMAGLAAAQPGSEALYSPELYARAYDLMFDTARALLRAGRGVVLDATFIEEGLRRRAAGLAADCGVPFHGIWLEASEMALRGRIAARKGDASDATAATLEDQLGRDRGRMDWRAVDAEGPLEAAVAAVAAWTASCAD